MTFVREEKGSVTVWLVVIFAVVLVFAGVLIDMGRIKIAQSRFRRAVNGAARSVVANYHTSLRATYGLFAVNKTDAGQDFAKYVKANILQTGFQGTNLLDYRYEAGGMTLLQSLGRPEVMKQQILEAMKYRAPVEIVRGLIDKFRQLGPLGRFYDDSNEKRKSQSRINEKIENIHGNNLRINQARDRLKRNKTEWNANKKEIRDLEQSAGSKENTKRLQELRQRQGELEREMDEQRSDINREIQQAKREKTEIEVELKKMDQPRDLSVYNSGDAKTGPVRMEDEAVTGEFEKVKQRQKEELQSIDSNIRKSAEALVAESGSTEVNEALFSSIGIGAATAAYQRIEGERGKTVTGNIYEQQLRHSVNQFTLQNREIAGYFAPEAVNGDLRTFEKTDGKKADGIAGTMRRIFSIINVKEELTRLRDEIYINEYSLTYFSFMTADPKGGFTYPYRNSEAEYICFGGASPMASAVSELYLTRFALDSLAYFAFSKAPTDLLARTAYSLIMGAVHASVDTFRLLALKDDVPLASMLPENPLEKSNLTLSYKDHLRLFMLLHTDEQAKLKRIASLIEQRSGINPNELYTLSGGTAEVSVKTWFLPLAGLADTDNGPFGAKIRGGRCYLTKSVEYGY